MDKTTSIIKFIGKMTLPERVELHNSYCRATGRVKDIIHALNGESVNTFFGSAKTLFEVLRDNDNFDIKADFFSVTGDKISTDIQDLNDKIADFVTDWGDYLMPIPGLNEHLIEDFIEYAYEIVEDRYSYDDIQAKVDNAENDFLMDDWDDIAKELFGIVGICPDCKEVIYADNADYMYNYDTARKIYYCPACGGEVLD